MDYVFMNIQKQFQRLIGGMKIDGQHVIRQKLIHNKIFSRYKWSTVDGIDHEDFDASTPPRLYSLCEILSFNMLSKQEQQKLHGSSELKHELYIGQGGAPFKINMRIVDESFNDGKDS